jgi:UDP-N-acetylmuramoyl-tripeptide--D-alanyl-D-alanine ligase
MQSLPLEWLTDALQTAPLGATAGIFCGVSSDTRQSVANSVFIALTGESLDGHAYAADAAAKGAIGLIVSRPNEGVAVPQWIVPDTTVALGRIAQRYRQRFPIPVIGVTGSVGKTSAKEMIGAMLSAESPTLISAKNHNNEFGVPQTLLNLSDAHRAAVIEMGMRGMEQIDWLAEIAQPTIGLITMIGVAHQELLGSRENIALAKSELYQRLAPGGVALVPQTSDYRELLESRIPAGCRVLRFGVTADPMTDVRVLPESVRADAEGRPAFKVAIGAQHFKVSLRAVGAHNVPNAAAALSVAVALERDIPQAIGALEAWEGAEGRMTVRQGARGVRLLDDCYNAAPESMSAAIATLDQIAPGGVAILGDMRELGAFAEEAHRQVGRRVAESQAKTLLTVGSLAEIIGREAQTLRPILWRAFPNAEACAAEAARWIAEGDTALLKGSRAMAMERIVAALLPQENSQR